MKHDKFKVSQYVVILNKKNKVLLLEASEKTKIPGKWSFPGGHIELKESVENSLKREIKEETNLEIKDISPINTEVIKDTYTIIFSATYLSGEIQLSDEHKNYRWVDLEEMKNIDLLSKALIYYTEKAIKNTKIN